MNTFNLLICVHGMFKCTPFLLDLLYGTTCFKIFTLSALCWQSLVPDFGWFTDNECFYHPNVNFSSKRFIVPRLRAKTERRKTERMQCTLLSIESIVFSTIWNCTNFQVIYCTLTMWEPYYFRHYLSSWYMFLCRWSPGEINRRYSGISPV